MKETKDGQVEETKDNGGKKEVIASRKSCDASGTGLSHYILMDRKAE